MDFTPFMAGMMSSCSLFLVSYVNGLATWMTPSIPSMISSNTPICEKSCISTNSSREACCGLAAFICSPFCLERVAARTVRPRANRLSTTWAPMKPVAPVTRMCFGADGDIFMVCWSDV
ncbi:hypothetical protein BDV41DRAFT_552555 [Aspergillus transmontanensis]|uniref:Secreted protein n=1 Tax=Aspergillus transmontanensis TaxID=1034304 RepID=A0A5N6VLQ4_9EURO|nr:hypothetical protein BDV41DRAFT_552555 [Aspergillus transmontanensis]